MKKGIIDGHIEVKPSKIVIETKLNSKEFIGKLLKYGKAFNENSQNQLWHLSSVKFENHEVLEINKRLKEQYPELQIQFNNLIFSDLIENLEGIGRELINLTKEKVGDQSMVLLLSVSTAMEYYPKVGFEKQESSFIINRAEWKIHQ